VRNFGFEFYPLIIAALLTHRNIEEAAGAAGIDLADTQLNGTEIPLSTPK
jgi:hypothetical protein